MSNLSLFDIEDTLAAFLETDDSVPPEQRAEFETALQEQIRTAVDKRERVGQFLRHCELQQSNCEAEIKRLKARSATFEAAADRLKFYIVRVIEGLGADGKGKYRKLEGHTVTFALRQNPPHVLVVDADAIPNDYKRTTISVVIDKFAIKKAIDAGVSVPGADIEFGENRLVIK